MLSFLEALDELSTVCEFPQWRTFPAEINVHFPGYEGLTKRTVWVFPQLSVCLNCGFTQLSIPEFELRRLVVDGADSFVRWRQTD
jgi:hypothetical protein